LLCIEGSDKVLLPLIQVRKQQKEEGIPNWRL